MNESSTTISNTNPRMAYGGKTVYGARVGILFVDTVFPRIHGDFGNLTTWPFPVLTKVVRGFDPEKVTTASTEEMAAPFVAAARELVEIGADGITTTCGFLSLVQKDLAAAAGVPVAASSLMQVPLVQRLLPPGRRVGVITVSSRRLEPRHLIAAGAPADTPVAGCEGGTEFARVFTSAALTMDVAAAEQDVLAAGRDLIARHPEVGALVLECANLLPFSRVLSEEVGLPVWDAYTFICWFHAGLEPRDFGHPGSAPRPWRER